MNGECKQYTCSVPSMTGLNVTNLNWAGYSSVRQDTIWQVYVRL